MNILLLSYVLLMNGVSYFLMWYDKRQAQKGDRRIPENRLFLFAFIGGSVGSFVGMHQFHHKTRHWNFLIGIPVFMLLHFLLLYPMIFFQVSEWFAILARFF